MATSVAYRWDEETFLRAHQAGVFDTRVELVEGEVWPVALGDWHGRVTMRVGAALMPYGEPTGSTLPSSGSLPDPDVWLPRPGAAPVRAVTPRLSAWAADDVLLVVEVSDETPQEDLTIKARLYGRSGYARYWVVTRDGVHEHTGPTEDGYDRIRLIQPGGAVPLPFAGMDAGLAVAELLSDPPR